jgi:hypothetical protein
MPWNRHGWTLGEKESRALRFFLRAARGDSDLVARGMESTVPTQDGLPFEDVLRRIVTLRREKDARLERIESGR